MSHLKGELKSETGGIKNYTEFCTDRRNFQSFLINQKLNVEICDHNFMEVFDVIEKCVGYSGKVCVSCVRAVVWSVMGKSTSKTRLKALGCWLLVKSGSAE